MEIEGKDSSFQRIILELICSRLNMLLAETFQLKHEVNFADYEKLTKIILKEISKGNVISAHMSAKEAKKVIGIFDKLNCHAELKNGLDDDRSGLYNEDDNPFSNSPF